MERNGDAMNVSSPDKTITVIFVAMDAEDFAAGTDKMAATLDKSMKDVKVEQEGEKEKVDGMDITFSNGTGVDKQSGGNIMWSIASIITPKKPVLVTVIGDKDNMDKHGKEFDEMLKSIKKQ